MSYTESKQKLDTIRDKYGCSGEIIFRTALQMVVEQGQNVFKDEAWYEDQMNAIDDLHDAAEADEKTLFMTRDFEKAIYECAHELTAFEINDLLIYIQKEVWFSDDGIDYQRSIYLLKGCIAWALSDTYETEYALQEVREMGFDDDEIEKLGFGWMLDV